ncbi:MAG: hypothetical protein AB7Q16_05475 [Vicinamibacterales bacterium]
MHAPGVLVPRPTSLTHDAALTAASGFLAVLAITTTMYLLPAVGLPQVDLPIWIARLFVSGPVAVGALGLAVHLAVGLAYAWLYVTRVEPRLAASPAVAGLTYGLALWGFAQVVAVPLLGAAGHALASGPAVTPGVLSWHLGAGAAAASLCAHASYGLVLGWVYGCHGGGSCRRVA